MAGRAGLLLRKAVRGLGRHACMLACRGRNWLLLMVVDMNMERRKEEPQSIETSKSDDRRHALADICLSPQSFFRSTVSYCGNTILTTHPHVHVLFHAHIAHVTGKRGHKKTLRHMTAG